MERKEGRQDGKRKEGRQEGRKERRERKDRKMEGWEERKREEIKRKWICSKEQWIERKDGIKEGKKDGRKVRKKERKRDGSQSKKGVWRYPTRTLGASLSHLADHEDHGVIVERVSSQRNLTVWCTRRQRHTATT